MSGFPVVFQRTRRLMLGRKSRRKQDESIRSENLLFANSSQKKGNRGKTAGAFGKSKKVKNG